MRRAVLAAAAVLSWSIASVPASAERMYGRMAGAGCDDASRRIVAEGSRNTLERSVRVAEAAIQPPRSVSDMGCLDGIFGVEIDTFTPTLDPNAWLRAFDRWVEGIARGLCSFAEDQWARLTSPVTSVNDDIQSLESVLRPSTLLPPPSRVVSGVTDAIEGDEPGGASGTLAPVSPERPADGIRERRRRIWDNVLGN